jgi:hypothetical protein
MSTDTPTPETPQQQEQSAPKKKSAFARVAGTILAFLLVGAAVYAFNYFTSDAARTKAGACASLTGSENKPEFKTVDCGAAEANYTVGKVLGSTSESCGGTYDEYTERSSRGPESKLCLVPNMVEGSCYDMDGTGMGYPKVDCGKEGALKAVKVAKDVQDDALCEENAPLSFPEPKLTICLAPVEAA